MDSDRYLCLLLYNARVILHFSIFRNPLRQKNTVLSSTVSLDDPFINPHCSSTENFILLMVALNICLTLDNQVFVHSSWACADMTLFAQNKGLYKGFNRKDLFTEC